MPQHRRLVQISPPLEYDSNQAWTIASSIMQAFPNLTFIFIVLIVTIATLSFAKLQQIVTTLLSSSTIIRDTCKVPSSNVWSPPLFESVNLVYDQPHVNGFQHLENDEVHN